MRSILLETCSPTFLVVLVACLALGSCGAPRDDVLPTRPDLAVPQVPGETSTEVPNPGAGVATLDDDEDDDDDDGDDDDGASPVRVCYRGHEWLVSPSLARHLVAQGATVGRCPADCPCFDAADIEAAAGSCATSSALASTCSTGGGSAVLLLSCSAGGPAQSVGVFVAQQGPEAQCQAQVGGQNVSQGGLSEDEYQGCRSVIEVSPRCVP